MSENEQYVKILGIFHFVVGGIAGLFACFPIFHFMAGLFMFVFSLIPGSMKGDMPLFPVGIFGLVFATIAGAVMLLGWAFAISLILAGYGLLKRKWHTFCLVMAGVACVFMPFGTVLGVLTIVLLVKPAVKELFTGSQPASG